MALPSATELYANVKKNEHSIYAASANIGEDAKYFYGGRHGSLLIFKGTSGEAHQGSPWLRFSGTRTHALHLSAW